MLWFSVFCSHFSMVRIIGFSKCMNFINCFSIQFLSNSFICLMQIILNTRYNENIWRDTHWLWIHNFFIFSIRPLSPLPITPQRHVKYTHASIYMYVFLVFLYYNLHDHISFFSLSFWVMPDFLLFVRDLFSLTNEAGFGVAAC